MKSDLIHNKKSAMLNNLDMAPEMTPWWRPTLPSRYRDSTIGADGLNFSVRNGKRCFPTAKVTRVKG